MPARNFGAVLDRDFDEPAVDQLPFSATCRHPKRRRRRGAGEQFEQPFGQDSDGPAELPRPRFGRPAWMPDVVSGGFAGGAGEQLQQWLGGDFDESAEPQNRGWPLAVVDESVGGCAPHTEQRGSLNEVENRGQPDRGI